MAFHHRKLLNESSIITTKVTDFCQPYCDDDHGDQNHNGTCPLPCISLCHPTCNTPFLEIPPPVAELPEPPIDFPYVTPDKGAHNKLSLLLTVSLAVLAAAFFLLTCYTVYKLCSSCYNSRRRRRRRRRLLETRGEANGDGGGGDDDDFFDHEGHVVDHPIWYIRTVGLQPSVISAISIVKYKKVDGLIEGTDCSVCLSEFQEGEALRLLPKCNHAFHIPCIDTWLRSHTNCPLCRAGIVKSVGQQELVAQGSGRVVVEARVGASGRSGGVISRRESQDGDEFSEVRIGVEEDSESWPRIGIKINDDLGEVEAGGDSSSDGRGLEGVQPMRRSVSVDSLSASVISAAVKGGQSDGRNSEDQMAGEKVPMRVGSNLSLSGLVRSSSSSNQTGPSYVRRSFSCTAKVFLSRYSNGGGSSSRSRNSVVPQ